jgi:hypothetical protein
MPAGLEGYLYYDRQTQNWEWVLEDQQKEIAASSPNSAGTRTKALAAAEMRRAALAKISN